MAWRKLQEAYSHFVGKVTSRYRGVQARQSRHMLCPGRDGVLIEAQKYETLFYP
ncbi:MAG: hypothetical protein KDB01_13070 [Planctomycetaceae bacterium]|nr:hypothetical protein [Planctomycetaceae bacterium]